MEVNFIGRPGYSTILSSKKKTLKADYYLEVEDKRLRSIAKGIAKIKELEDEKLGISGVISQQNGNIINFKLIKESQIIKEGPSPLTYSKSWYADQGDLLYKVLKAEGRMIRSVLEANGFSHTDGHDWNLLWTCSSWKPYLYDNLNNFQKINHFPQSSELTRKDCLCANVVKMQEKFKQNFDIIPETYILPDEFTDFELKFKEIQSTLKQGEQNIWIIKPSASSKGRGIYLVDNTSEVPMKENWIISRYINNPLLINGLKFDIRLYVLVTSIDPWRIYIFKEGLARFASEPYSDSGSKSNRFSHLTNYSINKKHEKYIQNMNLETDDEGNKWSLSALSKYLESNGVDMNLLWSRIYDIIIKSILWVDNHIYTAIKKIPGFKNNCFEVFGFDILLDSNLRPWILEANLSPSFATDSPLDLAIKSNLITDVFNLISLRRIDRRRDNITKMKQRFKTVSKPKQNQSRALSSSKNNISKLETTKKTDAQEYFDKNRLFWEKIAQITSKNRAMLAETLLEDQRKGNFIRIYPNRNSDIYDSYFIFPRASNKVLFKYLFTDEISPMELPRNFAYSSFNQCLPSLRIDEEKLVKKMKFKTEEQAIQDIASQEYGSNLARRQTNTHNSSASSTITSKLPDVSNKKNSLKPLSNKNSSHNTAALPPEIDTQNTEKLMITGDDVLIEYVARLMIAIKSIKEKLLKQSWKICIDKFIKHYVWHTGDIRRGDNNKLWQRLETRLIEMRERRKRLLKSLYKKELPKTLLKLSKEQINSAFEEDYEAKEQQKNVIIQALSALELEDMLRTSTKNVAHEVVSCLVEPTGRGVLTEIIRWLSTSQQNILNDHLSILDSSEIGQSTRYNNYEEDPEDSEGTESFYNTKSSMNTSGIRIKVRKSSVDPHSKKKSWVNKANTSSNQGSKFSSSIARKQKWGSTKPNKDIDIEKETVRAGSPLNYVRDKKRRTLKSLKDEGKSSSENSLIVMQPIEPS
jgi:hypothetical protein